MSDYKTISTDEYYTLNQVPAITYLGSKGDVCKSILDCHQNLYCINGTCDEWGPGIDFINTSRSEPLWTPNLQSSKEKFQSVPGIDYYQLDVNHDEYPSNNKVSKEVRYTSKYKANSGRNYW